MDFQITIRNSGRRRRWLEGVPDSDNESSDEEESVGMENHPSADPPLDQCPIESLDDETLVVNSF